MGLAAEDANIRRYVGNDVANKMDPSGLYVVTGMMQELEKLSPTHVKLLQFMLGVGGWHIQTDIGTIGKNWKSYDSRNIWTKAYKSEEGRLNGLGVQAEASTDEFVINYQEKTILIQSRYDEYAAKKMKKALDLIMDREDELVFKQIDNSSLDTSSSYAETMRLASDRRLTLKEGASMVNSYIRDMGLSVAIEVGLQFGLGPALRGAFYLLKRGYTLGSAVVHAGKQTLTFIPFQGLKKELGKIIGVYRPKTLSGTPLLEVVQGHAECVYSCFKMVADFKGKEKMLPHDEILRLTRKYDGLPLEIGEKVLEKAGFKTIFTPGDNISGLISKVYNRNNPVVVGLAGKTAGPNPKEWAHAVVVDAIVKDAKSSGKSVVLIRDPELGAYSMWLDDFKELWLNGGNQVLTFS